MRFRPYPILSVLTLVALVILILLGQWQYQRYQDKLDLAASPPPASLQFQGKPIGEETAAVYSYVHGKAAWRIVQPFELGDEIVLVTRALALSINPPSKAVLERATVVPIGAGRFVEPARRGPFTPQDDPRNRIYYALVPENVILDLGLADRGPVSPSAFEPVSLTVLTETGAEEIIDNPYADPRLADTLPPSRHFGYALTWWGLGLALLAMYVVFHHARGRLRFGAGQ